MKGSLYLIPNSLGSKDINLFLPPHIKEVLSNMNYFIVENLRNARRFLKLVNRDIDIDKLHFFELNKHTDPLQIQTFLEPLKLGHHMGILSEAGLPGIADPGAKVVAHAHRQKIRVVPLTGPSSIFLSLMASGMNGQSFRFCGYLPVKSGERISAIKRLEKQALERDETQIFIETPYRNMAMFEDIIKSCNKNTLLCIAVDITLENEAIKTMSIGEWQKKKPELNKRPAVFLIGK